MPTADLGDVHLHYRVHGDPSAPPLVGIMGFALDQRFWAGQIPAVTATHSFITVDNRGVGRSTGTASGTIDEMADDVVRLLDHLDIEKTVVMGASMGGTIAQRLVLDHPDRVSALVLAITWARPVEYMRRISELSKQLINSGGPEALTEGSLCLMFTPRFFEIGREAVDRMLAAFEVKSGAYMASSETLLAQVEAFQKHDTLADLHKIECPTLVVGGRMDMMVPFFATQEIAKAIPGAEFEAFETGHSLMVEEMEAFNSRLAGFLAGLQLET